MAALRIFARYALAAIRTPRLAGNCWKNNFPAVHQVQTRWIGVKVGVDTRERTIELPEFEVTEDPKEWTYVEWALRYKLIPEPPKNVQDLPSGWKPQSPETKSLPYFVERTKNHMVPVYLRITMRNTRRVTLVRKIQGDIYLLEKELKEFLEANALKKVGSKINEPAGIIKFRGDYVTLCRRFLDSKGF